MLGRDLDRVKKAVLAVFLNGLVAFRTRVCKNSFLSCVLQPIARGRGDFPTIYQDQRR